MRLPTVPKESDMKYAKAVVAALGAGATAALGVAAPHTLPWNVATVVVAVATVAGVYLARNVPAPAQGVTGTYVGSR